MTIHEAQTDFLTYLLVRKNRSASTVDTYRKTLDDFHTVIGNKQIESISIEDIDRYAIELYNRGNSPKTRRNRLATVRSFFRYLYIKDLADIKPEKIELPTVKRHNAVYLTTEEAQQMLSVVTDLRDRALILTLLTTWTRINECLDICLEDVYRGSVIIRAGKGDETRVVFLNNEACEAIRAYLSTFHHQSGYLFVNRMGTRLHERYVRRILQNYATQAGIAKHVSCHTLRHTGATGFLEAGGRIEDAQQILGHSDISTTMIYLHFTNKRLHDTHRIHTSANKYTYPQKRAVKKQKRLAL